MTKTASQTTVDQLKDDLRQRIKNDPEYCEASQRQAE